MKTQSYEKKLDKGDNPRKIYEAQEFETIRELIEDAKERYSQNIAYVIKHKEDKDVCYENITYSQLLEDVYSLSTYFLNNGYSDKKIGIIGKNQYLWIVAHLANLFCGIVSCPLDKDLEKEELLNSVNRAHIDVLLYDNSKLENTKILNEKAKFCECVPFKKQEGFVSLEERLEEGKQLYKDGDNKINGVKIDPDKMAVLLFTSGTTSAPKAIMLSNRNIASNVYGLNCCEDIRSNDVNIAFLPMHHIFGSTNILMMLSCGVKTVFPDGLKYIKQNLCEYKVSVFVGVPVLIEAIYNAIQKEIKKQKKQKLVEFGKKLNNITKKVNLDLSRVIFKQILEQLGGNLRLIISGGAPAREEILKGFRDFGIETLNGYGLSETAPVICSQNAKYNKATGVPLINVDMEIFEPDEKGIGEIICKGPNVFLGYYKDEEKTKEVLKDGWFHTGDLGFIDDDGYLHITGREKSMIVLNNGKKVFPEELESLIDELELVKESMVFGLPKEDKIVLSVKVVIDEEISNEKYPGKSLEDIKEILWSQIKEINTKFPQYKHIKNLIVTTQELVKTTTKKVKRHIEFEKILGNT